MTTPLDRCVAAAEARWRATIMDHGTDSTAPRIAAWRTLEALKRRQRTSSVQSPPVRCTSL